MINAIEERITKLESRMSIIEGKDIRDYDALKRIELSLEKLSTEMEPIKDYVKIRQYTDNFKNKLYKSIGWIIAICAAFFGGSDLFFHCIGIN